MLSKDDLRYLESLVRMDVRKKERGLAKLVQKPGWTKEGFEHFRQTQAVNLDYRRGVLERLRAVRAEFREAARKVRLRDAAADLEELIGAMWDSGLLREREPNVRRPLWWCLRDDLKDEYRQTVYALIDEARAQNDGRRARSRYRSRASTIRCEPR
jgi:hypothetical protein